MIFFWVFWRSEENIFNMWIKLTVSYNYLYGFIGFSYIKCIVQWYLTPCHPMDCRPPDSSVHRVLQARILERVAISYSRLNILWVLKFFFLCLETFCCHYLRNYFYHSLVILKHAKKCIWRDVIIMSPGYYSFAPGIALLFKDGTKEMDSLLLAFIEHNWEFSFSFPPITAKRKKFVRLEVL